MPRGSEHLHVRTIREEMTGDVTQHAVGLEHGGLLLRAEWQHNALGDGGLRLRLLQQLESTHAGECTVRHGTAGGAG